MAEAYAALMSLMHSLEVILHPSQQRLRINRTQIASLLQKVRSLQEFLENYSHKDHQEMAALERQIADMARAAESVIDYHVLDQIVTRSTGNEAKSSTSFFEYIRSLIKEMEDLIETEVMKIKETIRALEEALLLIDFSPDVSSRLAPQDQNTLVGSDKLIEVMDTLTEQSPNRQIIAIVGMGGIGKTTLAKNVYKYPFTVHHFHVRAWVTVSQNYSARQLILEMLSELYGSKHESVLSDYQLGHQLYKILFDIKYLIVIDDLWSIEAWYEIREFFPDNHNGSRIMITTRLFNVARELNSIMSFEMELLDDVQSWMLLRDKVFGKEDCPSDLEELGKDIAKICRGLPLAIVVIGGLLAKSNKTQIFWKYVTENLNSSIINSGDDENCLKILNLSYKNLPIHLKPSFLCIALISKGDELTILNLPWVLVAEGFLKPISNKSLEEVAIEYMKDLSDRNLVFVRKHGILGRVETWGVHDLLKDLCRKNAEKENFLFGIDLHNRNIPLKKDFKSCLSLHVATEKFTPSGNQVLDLLRQTSLMRSTTSVFASRALIWEVLEVVEEFSPVEEEITQIPCFLRNFFLRSRKLNSMGNFILFISRFWALQSLIISNRSSKLVILPSEIWDLPQLRHLISNDVSLRDPHPHNDEHNHHILENLQTLSGVVGFRCTSDVLKRAPNLKTLGVVYGCLPPELQWQYFCLYNLVHLPELETLKFHSFGPISLNYLSFPLSLKDLTLIGFHLHREYMTIMCSLPNLEALWLYNCTFEDQKWCPVEGEFLRLKVLAIAETDLLHWKADKRHFPILEHLLLRNLNLEEFPEDFGELPTLGKIEVLSCSDSTNAWTKQICEEQESFGNEDLQLIVHEREDA